MKVIAMIPARFNASRFPGKLMKDLCGKPVIIRTYEAAVNTNLFSEVYVVTDNEEIFKEVEKHGGKAIMSIKDHETGSDRIAEAVENIDADIVVNVQGDEPFIEYDSLSKLVDVFKEDPNNEIDLASLKVELKDKEAIENPNNVKVITDHKGFAIYFSRLPIPFNRAQLDTTKYFKHIGIYAFRKQALLEFAQLPMRTLEASEKLENLRYLEYGKKIKLVETTVQSIGIDTEDDLIKARKEWK